MVPDLQPSRLFPDPYPRPPACRAPPCAGAPSPQRHCGRGDKPRPYTMKMDPRLQEAAEAVRLWTVAFPADLQPAFRIFCSSYPRATLPRSSGPADPPDRLEVAPRRLAWGTSAEKRPEQFLELALQDLLKGLQRLRSKGAAPGIRMMPFHEGEAVPDAPGRYGKEACRQPEGILF